MEFDSSEYRRILGHFATGVGVIATVDAEGRPRGLTANTITSVSLDPALVLICVDKAAETHDYIARSAAFTINILDEADERISRRFAAYEVHEKFEGVAYREEVTGAPVLETALAWLDCRVWAEYPGGDHTIYVGEVVAGDAEDGSPLLYYRGGYGRFCP